MGGMLVEKHEPAVGFQNNVEAADDANQTQRHIEQRRPTGSRIGGSRIADASAGGAGTGIRALWFGWGETHIRMGLRERNLK